MKDKGKCLSPPREWMDSGLNIDVIHPHFSFSLSLMSSSHENRCTLLKYSFFLRFDFYSCVGYESLDDEEAREWRIDRERKRVKMKEFMSRKAWKKWEKALSRRIRYVGKKIEDEGIIITFSPPLPFLLYNALYSLILQQQSSFSHLSSFTFFPFLFIAPWRGWDIHTCDDQFKDWEGRVKQESIIPGKEYFPFSRL